MVGALEERGFITTPEQVVNFYLALLASPIVIMTGTSGTGKSLLPWLFAELTGSGFRSIPVKPQWDDNSDMFGFTSPIQTSQFIRGEFTTAIEEANLNPGLPFIVLLDEMNLAAVEHYFSDFLSVVESRRRQDGQVVTRPLPLDLPQQPSGSEDPYAELRTLFLPARVRVVGTANMDETTRSFSPKVLDRAFSIEFADVDLTAFPMATPPPATTNSLLTGIASRLADETNPVSIREAYGQAPELCLEAAEYLETVRAILEPTGISFAYRTRDAVCYYMYHWGKDNLEGLLPKRDALDYCILQKVLPKIHGQGEVLAQALVTLKSWLDGNPVEPYSLSPGFNRSAEKLERMIARLNADGTTTYWGS
jgi:5-methylcytosine-specific restriction endonuclease McrBC GTP-binding regulatory subunit McrB